MSKSKAPLLARVLGAIGFKGFAQKLAQRSVFKGAEMSRLWHDWVASAISADQEIYNDFLRLRGRARELTRNSAIVRMYLTLLGTNVIGPHGFKIQAQVKNNDGTLNKQLNAKIELAWKKWCKNCTTQKNVSMTMFSQKLIKNIATDGEVLIRKIRSFPGNKFRYALQQIDPDLLDHQFFRSPEGADNEVRLGVEIDVWGAPVAYWFWDRHPTDLINISARKRIRVLADEVIHLYIPDRANQTRGVTWLNSVMMDLKMLDGYVEAELVAARTGAAKMGFFQWQKSEDFLPPTDGEKLNMEASPGSLEMLPPGLEFKEWSPSHPSTAFPNFYKAIVRKIASGLGVSYNALANDLEGVNFSSMRSGLLIERDVWRTLQVFWRDMFLHDVYCDWLPFAMLSCQLVLDARDPEKFEDVRFQPRGWDWVDPLKDANASIAAINNGLTSRGRVIAEKGGDFEEILDELADEEKLIEESGVTLTGVGIGPSATAGDAAPPADDPKGADTAGDAKPAKKSRVVAMGAHHAMMARSTESYLHGD